MPSPLTEMLAELDGIVQSEYEASAEAAAADPQQAGHLAESTWARVLHDWLPNGYSVETRRYITPETNEDSFEMDLVVFRPAVPELIRRQTRIPHGAVAAAFSVRRTADRAGLQDAIDRAVRLRRSVDRSNVESQSELIAPDYPVGFLSLSHSWTAPLEQTVERVTSALMELDEEFVTHPAESLDLCCIGNLGSWSRKRIPLLPPEAVRHFTGDSTVTAGCPMSFLLDPTGGGKESLSQNPVGLFVRELYSALERRDPQLKEIAYSLRKQVAWPSGSSPVRLWR